MSEEKTMLDHIIEIKESQARTEGIVGRIDTTVHGNGQPGLVQKVGVLENEKWRVRGVVTGIAGVWSFLEWLFHHR